MTAKKKPKVLKGYVVKLETFLHCKYLYKTISWDPDTTPKLHMQIPRGYREISREEYERYLVVRKLTTYMQAYDQITLRIQEGKDYKIKPMTKGTP